jgi:hypothetical protein
VNRILLLACVFFAATCGPSTPSLGALQKESAAAIRMRDVVELGHFSDDARTTLEGPQPAFDSRVFGTQATDDAVRAFYDGELQRLGWQSDRLAGVMTTVELAACGWCKGAMVFRVGIEDQPRAFKPDFYRGQTFRTVFEAAIQGRDPGLGCPERPVK